MLTLWMAYTTLLGALIYLSALAGERIARAWRGAERFVWLAALVAAIAVPVLVAAGARPAAVGDSAGPPAARGRFAAMVDIRHAALRLADRAAKMAEALEPHALDAWIGASGVLLILFLGAGIRLRRQASVWREVELDGVRVRLARDVGPAVVGALRPQVVVPEWALSLDSRQRALMLRHELEHIRAHDARLRLVSALALIALPWNAPLWIIARRLRMAIEIDCDRRVLCGSADAYEYGSLLLAVAARASARPPFVAALAERRSLLERRIKAMTALPPRHRLLLSLPTTMLIALATLAAARAPRPALTRALTSVASRRAEPARVAQGDTVAIVRAAGVTQEQARRALAHPSTMSNDTAPRISVTYEDAPIGAVIAAFAAFSGRKIVPSSAVTGTVTATIVDKPWDVALEEIMGYRGYKVVFNSDGTIAIGR